MQAATEWNGSSAFKLRIAWVPLLAEFAELLQHDYTVQMCVSLLTISPASYDANRRRGYSNLFAFTLVATLTFIPAALLYMSTLRAQMRTAMPQSRIDSINGIGQTQQVAFLRDLKISYRLLILATCSFAFVRSPLSLACWLTR